jgi:thiamine-monophosphate kinase
VASTDLLIEDRHFRRDWSSGYDVGRRAAAANLADIVAMGARPTALLVGLGAPADLPLEWAEALADGLRDEAALIGASIVGGDVSAAESIVVAVTALGDLEGRPAVTRAGARPGDAVLLAGRPGRAAAGLDLLRSGRLDHPLTAAHRQPTIDYGAGLALAAGATAMIDVSDGLLADLGHIATASQVRIELTAADLPIDPALDAAAVELSRDGFAWVVAGGDDHCFAATVPSDGTALAPRIGRVVAVPPGEAPGVVVDRPLPKLAGHEHFRS